MNDIKSMLRKKIVILDGAMGTELQRYGLPQGVPPELWALENPNILRSVHSSYAEKGSDIIYTCTFGANRKKLKHFKRNDVRNINRKLAVIAVQAVKGKAIVAGDIGPTGEFIEPFGPLDFDEAVDIFKEQVSGLLSGGVDIFVIETMIDIQEARAALIAVKEITDKYTLVTFTLEKNGKTLNGTDPISALITLQSLGADAVGINCSQGPEFMAEIIGKMRPFARVPLVAKPNAGMPRIKKGVTVFDMSPSYFGRKAGLLVQNGASFVGGCCGTTPEHIAKLSSRVPKDKPVKATAARAGLLSSARDYAVINRDHPVTLIGECINPTGKKALQAELRSGRLSIVRGLAIEQESNGAQLLDVNVGVGGINETEILKKAVKALSVATKLPLVIDSSNIKAIEKALRVYPGRALINSISGEGLKIDKLLSIASKYGAMFILLPIKGKNIPYTFLKRRQVIEAIYKKALKKGFSKDDILVDGLLLSLASFTDSGLETLKTLEWCSGSFGVNTVLGLSNISFGLPSRALINASFLSMAVSSGLTAVIANPLNRELAEAKYSSDLLLKKDRDAVNFIEKFGKFSSSGTIEKDKAASEEDRVFQAILRGNKDDIKDLLKQAVDKGASPSKLVSGTMIPAINKAGDLFDKKEYFLPQLVASAETMKLGFSFLEPKIKKAGSKKIKKNVVLLATVKGDVHDIGKNIVALMLKNHGFSVIDLGKDVSISKIIQEIKRHKSPIVGLSALMTTTMVNIEAVVKAAKKERLDCRFIAGGAVVTKNFAESFGASYAKDGVEAVRVVKKLRKR